MDNNTIIGRKEAAGVRDLLRSSDKENQFIGLNIIENCEHAQSLAWLIVVYREMNNSMQKELDKTCPKLAEYLGKQIKLGDPLTVNQSYNVMKGVANNEDALKYLVEEKFPKQIHKLILGWGDFDFLKEYDIILTPKS